MIQNCKRKCWNLYLGEESASAPLRRIESVFEEYDSKRDSGAALTQVMPTLCLMVLRLNMNGEMIVLRDDHQLRSRAALIISGVLLAVAGAAAIVPFTAGAASIPISFGIAGAMGLAGGTAAL